MLTAESLLGAQLVRRDVFRPVTLILISICVISLPLKARGVRSPTVWGIVGSWCVINTEQLHNPNYSWVISIS